MEDMRAGRAGGMIVALLEGLFLAAVVLRLWLR
jgi:hypothetical protein